MRVSRSDASATRLHGVGGQYRGIEFRFSRPDRSNELGSAGPERVGGYAGFEIERLAGAAELAEEFVMPLDGLGTVRVGNDYVAAAVVGVEAVIAGHGEGSRGHGNYQALL
jgi:hypothetical protein